MPNTWLAELEVCRLNRWSARVYDIAGEHTMSDHEDVIQRISAALSDRGYDVQTSGTNLPKGSGLAEAIYRPDLIVRSRKSEDIIWLVEVETSHAGKSVVGAVILADICIEEEMRKRRPREKAGIIFIFYRASANLQLAHKKLDALKRQRRIRHLEPRALSTSWVTIIVTILVQKQRQDFLNC